MCVVTTSITTGGGSLVHNHRTTSAVVHKEHIEHELTEKNVDWQLSVDAVKGFDYTSDNLQELVPTQIEGGGLADVSASKIRASFKETFNELFASAVEDYNARQTREDRKITDYYQKIKQDKKKNPFTEIIVQVGNRDDMGTLTENAQLAKEILTDYMSEWQQRNPHLVVADAALHMDEKEGTPHLHIDFIPVATEQKRGLPMQLSLNKALQQQGFDGKGKGKNATEYIQWRESERVALEKICERHGIQTKRLGNTEKHIYTPIYKKAKAEEARILKAAQNEAEDVVSHANEQAQQITLAAQQAAQSEAESIVEAAKGKLSTAKRQGAVTTRFKPPALSRLSKSYTLKEYTNKREDEDGNKVETIEVPRTELENLQKVATQHFLTLDELHQREIEQDRREFSLDTRKNSLDSRENDIRKLEREKQQEFEDRENSVKDRELELKKRENEVARREKECASVFDERDELRKDCESWKAESRYWQENYYFRCASALDNAIKKLDLSNVINGMVNTGFDINDLRNIIAVKIDDCDYRNTAISPQNRKWAKKQIQSIEQEGISAKTIFRGVNEFKISSSALNQLANEIRKRDGENISEEKTQKHVQGRSR